MGHSVSYGYDAVVPRDIMFIDQGGIDVYSREGLVRWVRKLHFVTTGNKLIAAVCVRMAIH
jgi:hypothetical protein